MDGSLADVNSAIDLNGSVDVQTSQKNINLLKTEIVSVKLRKHSERCLTTPANKSQTYRISMANLEQTQESELDVILGELRLLEEQISCGEAEFLLAKRTAGLDNGSVNDASGLQVNTAFHSAMSQNFMLNENTAALQSLPPVRSQDTNLCVSGIGNIGNAIGNIREPRTESPDNDSAFSDTVSLLSSESSASSASSAHHHKQCQQQQHQLGHQHMQLQYIQHSQNNGQQGNSKAAKIQLALHKLEHASIRRLFVKAFTIDGASKSLLVDERMTCGNVARLLADKNHVHMQPSWALVESLGDLQMERLFEDHELLVDNLMTWNSDAGNRVLFQQRTDKISLFSKPELFLPGPQMAPGSQHDENTRYMLLEEFFGSNSQLQVDGPLYMKADSKKGWKRYHFVLRASGLYYFPKEKTKNTRDLACLTLFNGYNVYRGIAWKKKWKSPTEYTFGFKSAVDSSLGKTCRSLKMLCAEDLETLEKWITAIRISKYGKQLWDSHKSLVEDLSLGDVSLNNSFASPMRSESISSISSTVPSHCGSVSSAISSMSNSSSGRISRASSSSSSGCLSDDNNGFDSEFTTGTIKRKPSMKPNLPLTTMTRQLKEVGEITICENVDNDDQDVETPDLSGTLTRRHSRRKSQESNGSGTLKRRQSISTVAKRNSCESVSAGTGNSSGSSTSALASTHNSSGKSVLESNPLEAAEKTNDKASSTLSLDLLPPPPPPPSSNELEIYGSQLSLASLPPPPAPEDVIVNDRELQAAPVLCVSNKSHATPPAIPVKPIKSAVKVAPPYKAPPEYVGQNSNASVSSPLQKKVSFADSPVLLRRRVCESRSPTLQTVRINTSSHVIPSNSSSQETNVRIARSLVAQSPPKRLQDSTANPPRDFLKDLQRVMRKKWQVAQKCKLEPTTTPHEVLGFRDFSGELISQNLNNTLNSSHYYRETANVSNWVQEHYGAGAAPPPPPPNEYVLYENIISSNTAEMSAGSMLLKNTSVVPSAFVSSSGQRKKRPPPPPPKRSDSTQLTHRV